MERYRVKWKGRETGPFTMEELLEKVAAREIKGIYEVFEGGEWKTVRVFLKGRVPAAESRGSSAARRGHPPESVSVLAQEIQGESLPVRADGVPARHHVESGRLPEVGWETDLVALRDEVATPYAIRSSPATERVVLVYSGFWMRFLASLIDHSVVLFLPLWLVARLAGGAASASVASRSFAAFGEMSALGALVAILGGVLHWIYFAAMESSRTGATLGKMMLGLVVTSEDGERITFHKATARHFGKLLSALMAGAGFFLAAFTRKKQAFHDILADCTVNFAVKESKILEGSERLTNQ